MRSRPSRSAACGAASAALLVCLCAQAQSNTSRPTQPQAAAVPRATAAALLERGDRRFIEEATMAGMADVELGKLAQLKGASEPVKQFGARMVEDQGRATDELKQLAQIKRIGVPAAPDKWHARDVEKFSRLSGPEFDRQYVAHMLSDQRKDVLEFRKAFESAKDSDVRAFAEKTLPTLQEHLKLAQSLQDNVKTIK